MTDLRPCPFCGGEAVNEWAVWECIDCTGCGGDMYSSSEQEAIAAWNRRAAGWVSVEERLPEEPGVYLVVGLQHSNGEPYVATDVLHEKEGCWFFAYQSVTHWMPLPEPPEEA